MAIKDWKRRSENLKRRKDTLFKKAYELGKYYDIEVAVILHQNGRYFTYRTIDQESWPPSMKQIVSLCHPFDKPIYAQLGAASLCS
jgi:hypothetical protein